ncbi:hypothetical protein FOA43_001227 [Brettanomyces nanus]|uniref:FHA domain-containing protein n=1 Tax=Eeniella nana TaxID=13502 RepID=A0A875S1D4_EENNA|nr:uncharacterized protein FOA43_001227 [Brettanomyces nanus]QPG73912.1 hypothetical protein FOA43_001227 [Brettanomyces nanus]
MSSVDPDYFPSILYDNDHEIYPVRDVSFSSSSPTIIGRASQNPHLPNCERMAGDDNLFFTNPSISMKHALLRVSPLPNDSNAITLEDCSSHGVGLFRLSDPDYITLTPGKPMKLQEGDIIGLALSKDHHHPTSSICIKESLVRFLKHSRVQLLVYRAGYSRLGVIRIQTKAFLKFIRDPPLGIPCDYLAPNNQYGFEWDYSSKEDEEQEEQEDVEDVEDDEDDEDDDDDDESGEDSLVDSIESSDESDDNDLCIEVASECSDSAPECSPIIKKVLKRTLDEADEVDNAKEESVKRLKTECKGDVNKAIDDLENIKDGKIELGKIDEVVEILKEVRKEAKKDNRGRLATTLKATLLGASVGAIAMFGTLAHLGVDRV